jgi:hypothetical protein
LRWLRSALDPPGNGCRAGTSFDDGSPRTLPATATGLPATAIGARRGSRVDDELSQEIASNRHKRGTLFSRMECLTGAV